MAKGKRTKEQTTIYKKTLHRKLKISQHGGGGLNAGGPEGSAVTAPMYHSYYCIIYFEYYVPMH
jgi:hypothetical protein